VKVTNRREFLGYSGLAALVSAFPAFAAEKQRIAPRLIPGTKEALPVIGLGNSGSFRESDLSAAADLLDIYFEHGGGYVDVGGVSRLSVGTIAQSRNASDKIFMGNYVDPKSEGAIRSEIANVAEGQGKAALDLVHTRNLAGYRESHNLYTQMKEEGLVRYIGIARSGAQTFEAIGKLVVDGLVDFIQVNYSLAEPQAAERLLPLAADNGVAVNINRPFLNGRYFGLVKGMQLPEWAAEFDCNSWAQFSLKFIVSHPAVNCVLTETADPKHAIDNLGAGYGGLPDEATQSKMLQLMQGI
jgi:aryl-alcohol dehydrogenase-like predicted oxidoreductase